MSTSTDRVKAYAGKEHFVVSRLADGSITSGDVVTSGSNEIDVSTATGSDYPLGVALPKTVGDSDDYDDNEDCRVLVSGIARVEVNGTVSEGELLKTDAAGTVVAITGDGTDDTSLILGRALEAGTDGDRIEVKLY